MEKRMAVRLVFCTLALSVLLFLPVRAEADDVSVLRLMVWEGYSPEPFRERFEKMILEKYGRRVVLRVEYVGGSAEYFRSVRKKSVHLVSLTHHHFRDERFNYIRNRLLLPIDTRNIPRYREIVPGLRGSGNFRQGGKIYGVPICRGAYGLVYNTARLKQPPSSWQVFWAPEYKGQYSLGAREYLYNVCTAALAAGIPGEDIARFDVLNTPAFRQRLRLLARNAGGFWVGQDKAADLAGKAFSMGWGDSLSVLRKRGEHWQFASPKEGVICWVDAYALTRALEGRPFLKKVAEEWINFLLAPDFQAGYIVREISQKPVTTTVVPHLTPDEKKRLHMDVPTASSQTCILLPTCNARDRNGIKLLWDEAMEGLR